MLTPWPFKMLKDLVVQDSQIWRTTAAHLFAYFAKYLFSLSLARPNKQAESHSVELIFATF